MGDDLDQAGPSAGQTLGHAVVQVLGPAGVVAGMLVSLIEMKQVHRAQRMPCSLPCGRGGGRRRDGVGISEGSGAGLYDGGTTGGRWWDKDDHGTPEQRVAAFAIGYNGTTAQCEQVGNGPPGLAVQLPPFEIFVVNGSKGDPLQDAGYRLVPPDTTARADLRGYAIARLAGSGTATDRFDAVSTGWFTGADVIWGEAVTAVSMTVADGSTVEVPVNEQVSLNGSIYAMRYDQVYEDQPIHRLFILVVGGESADNPAGGIVLDVYDNGNSSASWEEVHWTALALLNGLLEVGAGSDGAACRRMGAGHPRTSIRPDNFALLGRGGSPRVITPRGAPPTAWTASRSAHSRAKLAATERVNDPAESHG